LKQGGKGCMRLGMDVLAPYATRADQSRGRLHNEPEAPPRSPFQRDRDRIVHSTAFRKLQYKTQVFVNHEGDFFRTRLTHSLEVAQIARAIARTLRLDEDLTEALALAHDLGHPPFGHAGEEALRSATQAWDGFDHNVQSLRVVTRLERRYAAFDGLNLTWETLEGLIKHNGPRHPPHPPEILELDLALDLGLGLQPSAEAQVAALADDIAYNAHDLDDGLRAGLFTLEELEGLPVVGEALAAARAAGAREPGRLRHEMIRRVIDRFIRDLTETSAARLAPLPSPAAVRAQGRPVVGFSAEVAAANEAVRRFLYGRMYRHFRVNRMTRKAIRLVRELFEAFFETPALLPGEWRHLAEEAGSEAGRAKVVIDYIAGMTDRYAIDEHRRLTDITSLG
jgi:dGTPase